MAALSFYYPVVVLASLSLFRRLDGGAAFDPHWLPATATWYGSAEGDGSDGEPPFPHPSLGRHCIKFAPWRNRRMPRQRRGFPLLPVGSRSDGQGSSSTNCRLVAVAMFPEPSPSGACGYGTLVDVRPLRARVGAVSPVLFKGGEGCGVCYKVRCLDPAICSRRPSTIIVTDECPGGYCAFGRTHFDLSGAAFGRMAISGGADQLRNRGEIPVVFRRTPCKYPGKNIAFHVNEGSTRFWLSLLVEFEDADGDIGSMHIKQGPFSVKLTTLTTRKTLSARDVIPRNWTPKATYTSRLNFS
ncbi:hypothetical protein ZIOFF_018791 [Zingiber officinale]|uniref:Expansin-like EG45 domain-containing protein n=1 Tax=Zingiber officinale TaxID=94328 RepID=A0A8J5HDC5_ZINOF|nr:hypothetical protein ZIOFF_018791 [Zingiber officinale]